MQITLYTKPGCHLCEDVKADLLVLQMEIGFTFNECNIENEPELWERYQYLIPVVDIDPGPVLYAPIDAGELHSAIQAATQQIRR